MNKNYEVTFVYDDYSADEVLEIAAEDEKQSVEIARKKLGHSKQITDIYVKEIIEDKEPEPYDEDESDEML